MNRAAVLVASVVLGTGLYGPVSAQVQLPSSTSTGLCGQIENAFGPFDYRTASAKDKWLVESAHFPPQVETLRAGMTGQIGADIDYTLRAFPNHPRALMSMVRLAELRRTFKPAGAKFPVECYFDRAIRFTPDDPMVRVLYGVYLAKSGRSKEASDQLGKAEEFGASDAQVIYNLGIGYFELKDYDRAVAFAKKAQEMGIQFAGLRERLQRAGKWPR